MYEPAATKPKPAPAVSPGRRVFATTAPGKAMPAQVKPGKTKVEQVKPVLIKSDLTKPREAKADRVKAPSAAPKTLSVRLRGLDPVTVPSVSPSVPVPAVLAPPATPIVAPTPELVLSQRAPVLVADARPAVPEPVAENAELASSLRSSSAPSGSTTGLAAVGGLMVLGLVSTRLTAKGRKRRSASGAAR